MAQIRNKFIANNAVNGAKIRMDNNESLRARNAGDSADVELLKLDTGDILQFLLHPRISTSASNADDVLTLKDLNAELEGLKPKMAVRAASWLLALVLRRRAALRRQPNTCYPASMRLSRARRYSQQAAGDLA